MFLDWLASEGIQRGASVLDVALELALDGVRVFPLAGKRPITTHGVLDATDNLRAVVRWFFGRPTINVGLAIGVGALTGIRVLDSDPRKGGDINRARLIEEHGPLPETLTVRTGRGDGGVHEYFAFPPGDYREKLCGRDGGLELLGVGKYVVGPKSTHPDTGGTYEVISPAHVGIAIAPSWLVKLATRELPSTPVAPPIPSSAPILERARAYLAKCDAAISGSYGHDTTFIVAQKLVRGFELDVETAYALMAAEYNPRCKPPWSERELRRKVDQAARAGHMQSGYLLGRRDAR